MIYIPLEVRMASLLNTHCRPLGEDVMLFKYNDMIVRKNIKSTS